MASKAVYALVDPRDGVIRYVGASEDPERRLSQHLKRVGPPSKEMLAWLDDMENAGTRPSLHVLVPSSEEWRVVEYALKEKYAASLLGRDDRPRKKKQKRSRNTGTALNKQSLMDFLESKKEVESLKPALGPAIRSGRAFYGMTQSDLARAIDAPQAYLSQIESSAKTPSSDSVSKILEVFDNMEGSTHGRSEDEGQEGAPEAEDD